MIGAGAYTTLKKPLTTASCRGRPLVPSTVGLRNYPRCFAASQPKFKDVFAGQLEPSGLLCPYRRDGRLREAGQLHATGQVQIDLELVIGIRRHHEGPRLHGQQVIFPYDPQHILNGCTDPKG